MKFPDIVLNQHIVVLLAFLNGTLPDAISSLFQLSRPLNTRGSNHFSIPFTYNVYRIFALPYAAPRTWNTIITTMHRDIQQVPRNKFTLEKHLKLTSLTNTKMTKANTNTLIWYYLCNLADWEPELLSLFFFLCISVPFLLFSFILVCILCALCI